MTRCGLLVAFCCYALSTSVCAQPVERELRVQAGRDVRVGIYTNVRPDCTTGPLPSIRLATAPAHGTVTVKRGSLKATNVKQCLAIEVPAFIAFYRAAMEFSGTDEFELEVTVPGGKKHLLHFRAIVSQGPTGGAGI